MDRKIEKKSWPPRKIATVAAGALFALFVIYNLVFADRSSRLNVETERITVSEVTEGPFQEYIPEQGTVVPIRTVFLDATEGGKVDTIYREAGSFVEAGDLILRLVNTALLIQISNQDAMVVEQRNLLTNTRFNFDQNRTQTRQLLIDREYQIRRLERIFERQKKLYEDNLISREEFEQSEDDFRFERRRQRLSEESFKRDSVFQKIQLQQLGTSLERLEQNLGIARRRLEDLNIRAPISGQLTSLNAEIGEAKSQGQRLGQIDIIDQFKVQVAIDEHYISRISLGQKGRFDFGGQSYELIAKKIYPEVTNGRFEVDMEFVGSAPTGIRRGQTLRIRLELGGLSDAVMLAKGGFYQKSGGNWAYVVDPSGDFAVKRQIRLGRQNSQVYEVLDGLAPGDQVITSTYDHFGDIDKLILR